MAEIGEIIRARREQLNLSQAELASIMGYKGRDSISKIEHGLNDIPQSKVVQFAKALNTTPAYLMGWVDSPDCDVATVPDGFLPMPATKSIPVVGRIACGSPITAEQNVEGAVSCIADWHADFALICNGDSMSPRILDGDIVAIRSQPEVENGQIAAVRIGEEATLKRVYAYPDRLVLQPENLAFPPIILIGDEMNTAAIEGRVVGICRSM